MMIGRCIIQHLAVIVVVLFHDDMIKMKVKDEKEIEEKCEEKV